MTRIPHQPAARRRSRTRAAPLAVVAAAALVAAVAAPPAQAGLIPAPGPWPVRVNASVNPLIGSPHVLNGGQATANADFDVWLPFGSRKRTALTRTFGGRTVVRGRLRNRDSKRPISGAEVTLVARTLYGGTWEPVVDVRTTSKGTFRAVLPAGHHRRVAMLYYPAVTSSVPVASRRLLIRSRSRVFLSRPFRKLRRSFRFDGRVSGPGSRTPRLVVSLQVRNRSGRWITAQSATTSSGGRFRIRYRFRDKGGYAVRAFVLGAQTDWPLYAGRSATQRIRAF